MKKGKTSGIIGVIAAIIIGIVIIQFSTISEKDSEHYTESIIDVDNDRVPDDEDPYVAAPRVWQTSGPFQIDRMQYRLGELVLIRIGDLAPDEKGQIAFLRPLNSTHYEVYITIPFDGSQKNTFNQYFKPGLSISTGTCSKDDLLGNWIVVFQGTNYDDLKFEIVDNFIPGEEKNYEKIC
jgi:hypothetical protein